MEIDASVDIRNQLHYPLSIICRASPAAIGERKESTGELAIVNKRAAGVNISRHLVKL